MATSNSVKKPAQRSAKKRRKVWANTYSKRIVQWGIWYANITTLGYFILLVSNHDVPTELIALTGTTISVIVASYAYKAKGENIAKIESPVCEEDNPPPHTED